MQGKKKYEEKLFTAVRLSRRIPKDNYYRKLKKGLKLKFIYDETEGYYGKRGKKSLDPVVYFKLCFIKQHEKLSSDKKLIEFCKIRLDALYFLDYNLDDHLPHPNTLYKTHHLFPEKLHKKILKQIKDQVKTIS
jgi:transposase